MNKLFAIPFLLCVSTTFAQVLDINSVEKLELPNPVARAVISPSGKYLLMSDYNYSGLTKLNLQSKKEKVVTKAAGAGYNAKILDNDDIIYREVTQIPIKKTTIKRFFSSSGNSETLVRPTRGVVSPESSLQANNVITNQDFQLQITINGKQKVISPLGKEKRYIWPSISPDGKRLLFFVSADGAYTSDLDGKNVKRLGIFRAPKWYNNDIIVGQRDKDNGVVTTQSYIVVMNIKTEEEQVLTPENIIAMYPSVTKNGDKILFSSPEGNAYIIHVNEK